MVSCWFMLQMLLYFPPLDICGQTTCTVTIWIPNAQMLKLTKFWTFRVWFTENRLKQKKNFELNWIYLGIVISKKYLFTRLIYLQLFPRGVCIPAVFSGTATGGTGRLWFRFRSRSRSPRSPLSRSRCSCCCQLKIVSSNYFSCVSNNWMASSNWTPLVQHSNGIWISHHSTTGLIITIWILNQFGN